MGHALNRRWRDNDGYWHEDWKYWCDHCGHTDILDDVDRGEAAVAERLHEAFCRRNPANIDDKPPPFGEVYSRYEQRRDSPYQRGQEWGRRGGCTPALLFMFAAVADIIRLIGAGPWN